MYVTDAVRSTPDRVVPVFHPIPVLPYDVMHIVYNLKTAATKLPMSCVRLLEQCLPEKDAIVFNNLPVTVRQFATAYALYGAYSYAEARLLQYIPKTVQYRGRPIAVVQSLTRNSTESETAFRARVVHVAQEHTIPYTGYTQPRTLWAVLAHVYIDNACLVLIGSNRDIDKQKHIIGVVWSPVALRQDTALPPVLQI
jgi:hypothetical protein